MLLPGHPSLEKTNPADNLMPGNLSAGPTDKISQAGIQGPVQRYQKEQQLVCLSITLYDIQTIDFKEADLKTLADAILSLKKLKHLSLCIQAVKLWNYEAFFKMLASLDTIVTLKIMIRFDERTLNNQV